MTNIEEILSDLSHRPYPLQAGQWRYYQEWNKVLFFYWKIPFVELRKCVPNNFKIDTFEGNCYVSLVAFTMEKIRPRYFPSISFISNFNEINLRTYIEHEGKRGIYFLSIEAEKLLSTYIAKALSQLPYEKSYIKRYDHTYSSKNSKNDFYFDVEFEIENDLNEKTDLDKWLTERYCLFLNNRDKSYRYDIHHKEWPLKKIEFRRLKFNYKVGNINLFDKKSHLMHYSDGVKVIAWKKQQL